MHGATRTAGFQGREFGDDIASVLSNEGELNNTRLLGRRVTGTAEIIKVGLEAVSEDELAWPKKGGLAALGSPM